MADKTLDFVAAWHARRRASLRPVAPSWVRPGARDALPPGMLEARRTGTPEQTGRNIATMDLDTRSEGYHLDRPAFPEAELVAKARGYTARFVFRGLEGDSLVCERSVNGRDTATLRIRDGAIALLWEGRLRDGRSFTLELQRVQDGHYAQGELGNVRIIVNKGEPVSEGPVLA
jgi:hypothetical protein